MESQNVSAWKEIRGSRLLGIPLVLVAIFVVQKKVEGREDI